MRKKILFFTVGPVATAAEAKLAGDLNAFVRAACFVNSTDNPEKCDAVAGAVPEVYKKAGIRVIERKLTAAEEAEAQKQREADALAEVQRQKDAEEAAKQKASANPDRPENTAEGAEASKELAANGWGQPSV